jgi:hypothetical protein
MTSIGSCGDGNWDINQHRYNKVWEYTADTGPNSCNSAEETHTEMMIYIQQAMAGGGGGGSYNTHSEKPAATRAKIESSHDVGIGLAARLNKL